MDIEFHYYITYVLAVKAGFGAQDAWMLAYSSQYVDDNDKIHLIDKGKPSEYQNYLSQTMDITKPQSERLRIYPCFHFVPGEEDYPLARRKDKKTHPLNTTPNSPNANKLMDEALQTDNLYRIGIATHAFADTWAHQNFVGCEHKFNARKGFWEQIIPNIGHADAKHLPDIPFLIWNDERLAEGVQIYNKQRFLEAAYYIFVKYCRYTDRTIRDEHLAERWELLRQQLDEAIGKDSKKNYDQRNERIGRIKAIADIAKYDWKTWLYQAVGTVPVMQTTGHGDRRPDIAYVWKVGYLSSPWYLFQEAVKAHQKFAIALLKPRFDRIGFADLENF